MFRKYVLLAILSIFLGKNAYGQEKFVAKADKNYEEYSFSPAIDIYKKVLDKGFESSELLTKLGNSYYYNANYQEAAKIYQKLANDYEAEMGPDFYFRYAQSLKSIGNYTMADEVMGKFSEKSGNDKRAGYLRDKKSYLEEIEKNSGRYDLLPFNHNTVHAEFAPTYYKDGLIFSSDRDTGNLARYRHTWNSRDFLDLYKVDVDSSTKDHVVKIDHQENSDVAIEKPSRTSKIKNRVNTRLHESTSFVTKDGTTLYFTRNNFKDGKYVTDEKGTIRLKVFKATMSDDGIWRDIVELPFNSDAYSVAHPTLSPDEKTLYFASDMPGTYGESDIFRVTVDSEGNYGTPQNLGNNINSAARETFPFISSDNVIYFASDGHPGLGGLDIFASKIKFEKFDNPVVNVGSPVNGKMDDFTLIFDEGSRKGYFASNRDEGIGSDDIFAFVENTPLKLDCLQQVSGTVRDKISNEVLVGATVKVIDEKNEEVYTTVTDAQGKYTLSIDCNKGNFVRALMQGFMPSEEFLARSAGKDNIIDFYLERDKITAGFGDDLAKLLQLSTIYFDFDKYNIRKDSEIEVQKVIAAMEKYPSLKIKVNSHTDSRGRDAYNLKLSQRRAESTVNYMISKGIAKERLNGEGFGETKLINKCSNGVKCSAVEHEKNRRSEFIILE